MAMENDVVYAVAANIGAFTAAVWDVRTRRVPNALALAAFAIGLALHSYLDGWHGAGSAFLSGLIAGVIFLAFYCAGGMGGGDVKLMAAVATLYGLAHLPSLLVFTSLAGGAMAIVMALRHGRMKETLVNVSALAMHHGQHGLTSHAQLNVRTSSALRLPYGVAIAAGCFLVALGRA